MKLITLIFSFLAMTNFCYSVNADTVIFKDGELFRSTIKETKVYVPKDIFFLEGALGEYMSLSANYQKQIKLLSSNERLFLVAGIGFHGVVEPDSYSLPISLKYVYGNTNAMEIGVGTLLHFQTFMPYEKSMSYDAVKLTGSLSYRFQKKFVNINGETDTDFFTVGLKTIYQFNSREIYKQHFITAINLNINIATIF